LAGELNTLAPPSGAYDNAAAIRERDRESVFRAFTPEIVQWLSEPDVIEIMLNPDGSLWLERLGQPMTRQGDMLRVRAEQIIMNIAGVLKVTVTAQNPILECEIPYDGSRFEALIPPVVSSPSFTIRRKASRVFTLDEYVTSGTMTLLQKQVIEEAINPKEGPEFKQNILVVGGTGSGKTTLTNAILHSMAKITPHDRIVIIEDTAELQCSALNVFPIRSNVATSMLSLLKATMRLRPDRICVGEVRGGEALALLKAWNTGHPGGIATIHANDARAGLTRLESLVEEATPSSQQTLIAEAVNLVVCIGKTPSGRRIRELLRVRSWDGSNYITEKVEG
jgi:type IV secretion system protein VirB11